MGRARRTAQILLFAWVPLLLGGCVGTPVPEPPALAAPEPSPEAAPALEEPVYPVPGPAVALLDRLTEELPLGWGSRLVDLGNNGLGEVYRVEADGSLSPAPSGWVAVSWEITTELIQGTALEGVFDEFWVTNNTDSGIDAFVTFGDTMALGLNLAAFRTPSRWFSTAVHELGHAFTADSGQLANVTGCDTFEVFTQLCVIRGSRLHQWHEQFWSGYGEDAPSVTNKDLNLGSRFRSANPSHFVSDYAAVNFFEDIAEHFRVFVAEPLRDDPAGVVMWQKQMWFAQFPELLEFRQQARQAFAGLY